MPNSLSWRAFQPTEPHTLVDRPFDAILKAFRRDVVADGILLPYLECFDHVSWHASQKLLIASLGAIIECCRTTMSAFATIPTTAPIREEAAAAISDERSSHCCICSTLAARSYPTSRSVTRRRALITVCETRCIKFKFMSESQVCSRTGAEQSLLGGRRSTGLSRPSRGSGTLPA